MAQHALDRVRRIALALPEVGERRSQWRENAAIIEEAYRLRAPRSLVVVLDERLGPEARGQRHGGGAGPASLFDGGRDVGPPMD